jgi:tRNA threonylcarbamoyladenosine biosynthesis protein TsaE
MAAHDAHDDARRARQWCWPDEAACAASANRLAAALAAEPRGIDACIELHGPLGAGKTTFVRHLLRALGVGGRIKSPTYTVVEPYRVELLAGTRARALDISHFDFYRFEDARELVDAGLRDAFTAQGLKLVEWPQRAAAWLPTADLRLEIEPQADESRLVRVRAFTPRGEALLT